MMRALILLLATSVSTPALAQHAGHNMGNMTMPMPTQARPATPHAGHQTPQRRRPARRARTAPSNPHAAHRTPRRAQPARRAPASPHAGHQMPQQQANPHAGHQMPPQPQANPHAGHPMPRQSQSDPHAGHDMGNMTMPTPTQAGPAASDPHAGHTMSPPGGAPSDPHAGHDTSAMESPAPPVAPPPPEALSGPAHAADTVFDPSVMSATREALRAEHGDGVRSRFSIDQLELDVRRGRNGFSWEGVQFWYGGDLNKLWLKSDGEGTFGEGIERAEVQALWSRAIAPFFDVQAGLRQDLGHGPDRTHLVLGIQGLAPYWFEIDAAAFLSSHGDLTARGEAEYDLRITQRLILQPRLEANFSLQDVPELNLGSGLTTVEAGLRLRYQFVPEFAPYVGVQYERALGDTADFRRVAGEDVGGWSFVLGVRAWF